MSSSSGPPTLGAPISASPSSLSIVPELPSVGGQTTYLPSTTRVTSSPLAQRNPLHREPSRSSLDSRSQFTPTTDLPELHRTESRVLAAASGDIDRGDELDSLVELERAQSRRQDLTRANSAVPKLPTLTSRSVKSLKHHLELDAFAKSGSAESQSSLSATAFASSTKKPSPAPVDPTGAGDKVIVGVEDTTGKIILKDRRELAGGPYTTPKWRHSLPFLSAKHPPPPPNPNMEEALPMPDATASFFSLLFFSWVSPIMALGAARPLAAGDLWKMAPEREPKYLSAKLANIFQRRWEEAEAYNVRLGRGEEQAPLGKRVRWAVGLGGKGTRGEKEAAWRMKEGRREPSLAWTLSELFGWYFWSSGVIKVVGDMAQVCSTLLVRQLILFNSQYHAAQDAGTTPPSVGAGIGYAIGLALLLITSSLSINQFFLRSAGTGALARSALISAIYERSLKLSGRARLKHPNGALINHISTDISRIDFCAGFFHMIWTSPLQLVVIIIILIIEIGPSSLVGIGFLLILAPVQTRAMKYLFSIRVKSMKWTDQRARLLQELLGGMKIVKLMAWEMPFLERLGVIRSKELAYVRSLLVVRAGNMAVAMSLPTIAAILSFITKVGTGGNLQAASVFTSLTLFNLVRMPLMIFPLTLSSIVDASNALGRIQPLFQAETLEEKINVDRSAEFGIKVDHASWTWDSAPPEVEDPKQKKKDDAKLAVAAKAEEKANAKSAKKKSAHQVTVEEEEAEIVAGEPTLMEAGDMTENKGPRMAGEGVESPPPEREIFKLLDIDFEIPKGAFVAVVGAIGSGKSSLLNGLVNEMRRTEGKVTFGGTTSLVTQLPFITNSTVRQNILFGQEWDEERYWWAVRESCLESDLDMLEDGDATEIGEKGINLSGGQKARVNLARAFYFSADVMLLDDPLSAVDPAISAALFYAIAGLHGKTRILVTHALHFLHDVDLVITLQDGRIAEFGSYAELKANDGAFAKLIKEFGHEDEEEEKKETEEEAAIELKNHKPIPIERSRLTANMGAALMQGETMAFGHMSGSVYAGYLKAGDGKIWIPLLLIAVVATQGASIMSGFWLVYWSEYKWPYSQGFYMGIYLLLGIGSALTMFVQGAVQALLNFRASVNLHKASLERLMKAPLSFYETTPMGRISSRMTKDIDTLDNTLGDALRMGISTVAQIIGSVVLIGIVSQYFLIAVVVILVLYCQLAAFYQKSALMLKRIDAVLRSPLYAHFSESLTGMSVIRSYGESQRFIDDNCRFMEREQRAYYLTIANQRWLGIRLDSLGTALTFSVAFIVVFSRGLSPASGGLILSYMVTVQQSFSWVVRQLSEVQNDMNSAERVLEYAEQLDQEAPFEIPETKPPADWPSEGKIEFKDVVMCYRPGLPAVLKGLSLSVGASEKIGIVGRTGAGKSSILSCLFRLVELTSGTMTVDGVDISKIGLSDLRRGLSIIPQDPLLFAGTIRSNLDPFGEKNDEVLWTALKRAHLVDSTDANEKAAASFEEKGEVVALQPGRFTLDTVVEDEGANMSIGERSLVSLARALVRDAKVVVLDECTAAVDLETDAKIQETIRREFKNKTLLCIAHRIRTILSYDKILVMAAGNVEEFDTPLNLFIKGGHFATMCEKSNISLEDVKEAAARV